MMCGGGVFFFSLSHTPPLLHHLFFLIVPLRKNKRKSTVLSPQSKMYPIVNNQCLFGKIESVAISFAKHNGVVLSRQCKPWEPEAYGWLASPSFCVFSRYALLASIGVLWK